jgi:excisionase family DNA binding protein
MKGKKTYGIEEAAEILGVSRQRIYQLIKNGILQPINPIRRLEIPESEIEKEIEFRKKLEERRQK